MSHDPFDLPEGYGGTGLPGDAAPAPSRKSIAQLEAELAAQQPARSTSSSHLGGGAASPARPAAPVEPRAGFDWQRLPDNARRRLHAAYARMRGAAQPGAPVPAAQPLGSTAPSPGTIPPFTATIARDAPAIAAPSPWPRRWLWIRRGAGAFVVLLALTIVWLAITAPLSRSLRPIAPPQLTLVAANGRAIARNGAITDRPVDATKLPPYVIHTFIATEDRRFYSHWGVDPQGIARAMWTNLRHGSRQGGSTITQQLAKFTFLKADQTYTRKAREMLIAWWMEAWLTKDEILSRYLSNAYFGDNVYGLRAASLHYFYRQPERLTLSQAAMLAGLLKAPNRLAPTRNLAGARERERVVLTAMVDAGYLTPAAAHAVPLATIDHRAVSTLPTGTYFADWAMPQARSIVQPGYEEARVTTTLDARLQDIARRVTARRDLGQAQIALVAMRPNGEVVAMIGGRHYAASSFNRATQARRQPGSTFKLFVYLAAMRAGMTPDTMIDDSPITSGEYRPENSSGHYRGQITLREAFARSSNVAAVRLYQQLGGAAVARAAHDLGVTSPLADNASTALGSSGVTLLELTSAYAAVAGNYGPVNAHALREEEPGFFARMFDGRHSLSGSERAAMLDLLRGVIDHGTGHGAHLAIPAFGKTGTSQDSRDALFVGFAGDLVVGVWVGNDDNSPLHGVTGGGIPASVWRDFMAQAIPGAMPQRRAPPPPAPEPDGGLFDDMPVVEQPRIRIDGEKGVALDTRIGDVGITINRDGVSLDGTIGDTPVDTSTRKGSGGGP